MNFVNRPNHIEDYLISLHTGSWFDWTDGDDKTYANLILTDKVWDYSSEAVIDNPHSKPSEADCTNGLKTLQDAWDVENDSYKSKRRAEYPSIADQLDDIYNNGIDAWKATIKTTKDKYPKE